ncbi:MAG: hypothetical protein E7355_04165 [Clostridiales bacterium]|nr:hypothetical protein [Clostridiales bacterium]
MLNKIFTKTYALTGVDKKEVLRYAGYRGETSSAIDDVLAACIQRSENAFSYRVCYAVFPVETLLCRWQDSGNLIKTRLQGAEYAVVFAATVGLDIDRLILAEESVSPTRALFMQALGAERIERLCDVFCEEMQNGAKRAGYCAGARFSAGYGDFPLEKQRDIFAWLRPETHIGLTLNDGLLMSPTKSVTAILPIGKNEKNAAHFCADCTKENCQFKR